MAMAMICDRCGQIYTPTSEEPRYVLLDSEKRGIVYQSCHADLCPDCSKKLEAWMEFTNDGRLD